jgi:hypothetical protein
VSTKYILQGHTPVPVYDVYEWATKFDNDTRRVGLFTIGDVMVSTVFLGLDHQYGDGPPLLFETMTFKGQEDIGCERCSTWEQAEAMHARAVAKVKGAQQ